VLAQGTSAIWLTGGAVTVALVMIVSLLGLVIYLGGSTFWPRAIVQVVALDGQTHLGEIIQEETFHPTPADFEKLEDAIRSGLEKDRKLSDVKDEQEKVRLKAAINRDAAGRTQTARDAVAGAGGGARRRKFHTGNRNTEGMGEPYIWVPDYAVVEESWPEWAIVFERQEWANFYGIPEKFLIRPQTDEGQPLAKFEVAAEGPEESWKLFEKHHADVRAKYKQRVELGKDGIGALDRRLNNARLNVRAAELNSGSDSEAVLKARAESDRIHAEVAQAKKAIEKKIAELLRETDRFRIAMKMSNGLTVEIKLADVVRGYPANQLDTGGKLSVYASRWGEFLTAAPREANTEGGVLPAIFGTVAMTLVMTIIVVPFGVLAALYLREYARSGPMISVVRIAINNLAGVPSIVFGIFGLGFFCYVVGVGIDQLFFSARDGPTFGTGGLFWASLTLALLTLPVVIVATEEALAAVPNSMREGSYACGASKWQTIRRIVLPRAMPGIMTGMILAIARGAGEVAPLMLVGAVKHAPELPVDGTFPFLHPERSFMHLGFHIYDVGFQSQDSEAARPMVFTTTLLLIGIVAILNLLAIWLRARLRRRFKGSQF
jgi:phosphate transport system permease protein